MPNLWIITDGGRSPGSPQLVGCKIKGVDDANGSHYQFCSPSGTPLATTPGPVRPTPPFDFPEFPLPGGSAVWNWNIHVSTFTGGVSQNKAEGNWRNNDPNNQGVTETEVDVWTAQAGQGEDEPKDASAASA